MIRAINFMNRDVKTPLGIKVTISNSSTPKTANNTAGSSSYFGG